MSYTGTYLPKIKQFESVLQSAESIVLGAGSGLSIAAGLTYSGERFRSRFSEFIAKYHYQDMYSAGFYPYATLEEYWAYWSRHIYFNRYEQKINSVYEDMFSLIRNKEYFVITTNVDHCFQKTGFDKSRLFYTQGDYGLWQCSKPCHQHTYDNEEIVRRMVNEQKNMKIPTELIPYCPICGDVMRMNLRCDDTFVEDKGWHLAAENYKNFLQKQRTKRTLYLEIGVGWNTPGIIKYSFWNFVEKNSNAMYVIINPNHTEIPTEIKSRTISLNFDIESVLSEVVKTDNAKLPSR